MSSTSEPGPPCFVVSAGRSGSMMLARVLALHPDVGAFHEPRPWLNAEAYLKWRGRRSSKDIHAVLRKKRDDLIEQVEANRLTYVESSHFLSHLIPELAERYDARFVHLFRSGRDFVRSGLDRNWYRRKTFRARIDTWLRRTTGLEVGNSFCDHRLAPPRLGSRLARIAWLWAEINGCILQGFERLPAARTMAVRLEDFGRSSLLELLAFLSVEAENSVVDEMLRLAAREPNRTKDPSAPPPEEWSEEAEEAFRRLAGPMMAKLGYAID